MLSVGNARSCLVRAVGAALICISLGYIAVVIWSQRDVIQAFRPSILDVALLGSGVAIYAAAGMLLAGAWRYLLSWSGERSVSGDEALSIYARTQIGKYIPGNIAQIASRQVLGREAGLSHLGLALSSIFELLSLLYIGALLSLAALGLLGIRTGGSAALAALLVLALTAFALIFAHLGRQFLARSKPELGACLARCRLTYLWPVALLHLGFFLIGGGLLALVLQVAAPYSISLADVPAIAGLFAAAWLAGVITPGAPSGMGVREAVLVLGLAGIAPPASAVLTAGLLRLVTVGGDLIFFAIAGRGVGRSLSRPS